MVDFKQNFDGRGVPQNLDAERSVLGALLLHTDAVVDVTFLKPDDFYQPQHKLIYQSILDTYDVKAQVDLLLVEETLSREALLDECGGREALFDLAQSVVSAAGAIYHAEIVREKIFHLTEQEVPYATHVEVRQFDETERDRPGGGIVRIFADVVVERSTQKGIVIGKGGSMLKRIGTLSRKELQDVLDCRVHLELFVKVERDWTRTARGLRKVGFQD